MAVAVVAMVAAGEMVAIAAETLVAAVTVAALRRAS